MIYLREGRERELVHESRYMHAGKGQREREGVSSRLPLSSEPHPGLDLLTLRS